MMGMVQSLQGDELCLHKAVPYDSTGTVCLGLTFSESQFSHIFIKCKHIHLLDLSMNEIN